MSRFIVLRPKNLWVLQTKNLWASQPKNRWSWQPKKETMNPTAQKSMNRRAHKTCLNCLGAIYLKFFVFWAVFARFFSQKTHLHVLLRNASARYIGRKWKRCHLISGCQNAAPVRGVKTTDPLIHKFWEATTSLVDAWKLHKGYYIQHPNLLWGYCHRWHRSGRKVQRFLRTCLVQRPANQLTFSQKNILSRQETPNNVWGVKG